MLIARSLPHPFSARTPRGGSMTARMNLQISVQVRAIAKIQVFGVSRSKQ